jgi:hypothetical protein
MTEQEAEVALIDRRLEFAVPAALVPFMETPLVLSRGEALARGNDGLLSRKAIVKPESSTPLAILGDRRAKAVQLALAATPLREQTTVAA